MTRRLWRGLDDDYLLSQNSELREDGVWNWSLPAWVVTLADGSRFNVCPAAGACAKLCYARHGTYRFSNVHAAHLRNLQMVLDDLAGWEARLTHELRNRRRYHHHKLVRIHDGGDFFSDDYLAAWLRVMRACPHMLFYAYTKEVSRFKRMVEPDPPRNFRWIYSLGGQEDHLVDRDKDRHADVFPTLAALVEAGYVDQSDSDILAATLPTTRIGIVANNITHLRRQQGDETFASLEAGKHRARRG